LFIIIVDDLDRDFTKKPSATLHRAESLGFGYACIGLIAVGVVVFCACGAGLSKKEGDELLVNNTIWTVNKTVVSGEQVLYPIGASNETAIGFASKEGNLRLSAISSLPGKAPRVIDANPGTVVFRYLWDYECFIEETGHIGWNFDASVAVTVKITNSYGDEVFYRTGMIHSEESFHPKASDSYRFRITSSHFYDETALVFKTFLVSTKIYDLSNVTVWSTTSDVDLKHSDTQFSYVVVEPKYLNITPENYTLRFVEYDDWLESARTAYTVFCALLAPFVIACVVIALFACLDASDSMPPYCCGDHSEPGEEDVLVDRSLVDKPNQLTSDITTTTDGGEITIGSTVGADEECCDPSTSCEYKAPNFDPEVEPSAPPMGDEEPSAPPAYSAGNEDGVDNEEEESNSDEELEAMLAKAESNSGYDSIRDNLD